MGETFTFLAACGISDAGAKAYLPGTAGRAGVVLTVGTDGIGIELVEEEGLVLDGRGGRPCRRWRLLGRRYSQLARGGGEDAGQARPG